MSIDHVNLSSQTPFGLLRKAQADARKEYDRAKAERDQARADMHRAEQSMQIWNAQLHEFQQAITAIEQGANR